MLQSQAINTDHFDGILNKSYLMPPILSSHMYSLENLLYLIKNVLRSTLLIYIHRRVLSAVNEAFGNWCRRGNGYPGKKIEPPTDDFFDDGLGYNKQSEMSLGASKLLRCETYDAIVEYAPNMLFTDYKQANELHELISERYCPNLGGDHIASNAGADKETLIFVKVQHGLVGQPDLVELKDWLKAKQSTLEWSLGWNSKATCTGKTRLMEDNLFGCGYGNGFVRAA
jgi:hypothetical protein